jgi:hypothetical protein
MQYQKFIFKIMHVSKQKKEKEIGFFFKKSHYKIKKRFSQKQFGKLS